MGAYRVDRNRKSEASPSRKSNQRFGQSDKNAKKCTNTINASAREKSDDTPLQSIHWRVTHALQSRACNIGVHALQVHRHAILDHAGYVAELEIGVAGRGVLAMVFQAVKILVALAADFASVWFLFLHAHCAGVGDGGDRVDDREGTVGVFL